MRELMRGGGENPITTTVGALLGATYYAGNVGMAIPQTQEEWVQFAIAILLFVLSYFARDAAPRR